MDLRNEIKKRPKPWEVMLFVLSSLVFIVAMTWSLRPLGRNDQVKLDYLGMLERANGEPVLFFNFSNNGDSPVSYRSYYNEVPHVDFLDWNKSPQIELEGCRMFAPQYVLLEPHESILIRVSPFRLHGPWYAEVTYWPARRASKGATFRQKIKDMVSTEETGQEPATARSKAVDIDVTNPVIVNLMREAVTQSKERLLIVEAQRAGGTNAP